MAARGRRLFALYGLQEILQNSSPKPLIKFWNTFMGCSRNFDRSINMALVNGGFLHYADMKKFLNNLLLRN